MQGRKLSRRFAVWVAGASAAALVSPAPTLVSPPPIHAQEAPGTEPGAEIGLTLDEAISEALAGNPTYLVSSGSVAAARADARAASAPLLPSLEAGAGFTRSTDPVFAFGSKLRQERFGASDLELDALNRPGAVNDWSVDVGVRWRILDPTTWAGRSAAGASATAAAWRHTWTAEATTFRTRVLYYAAAGSEAALTTAEAEEAAAREVLESFRRREERELLTRADVLQAEAELRRAEAMRSTALRDRDRARENLALHLGWGPERVPVPVDPLEAVPAPPNPDEAGASPADLRADVRALAAARDAAESDADRATLGLLPRLEAFGGWSGHAADAFQVDGSNWTVGAALRWTLFDGLARSADRERAAQNQEIARVRHEEAIRTASMERAQAYRDVRASASALEASRAAAAAADEARRLMRSRFDAGLATSADLLQAEARAAGARGREIGALVDYNVAVARLQLVASSHPGDEPAHEREIR